jgi:hypothetical protein
MATSQSAVFLGQRYADPVLSPDPAADRDAIFRPPRLKETEAAGVPSKRQDAWAVPDPSFGVDAPLLLGVIVRAGP